MVRGLLIRSEGLAGVPKMVDPPAREAALGTFHQIKDGKIQQLLFDKG